MFGFGNKKLDNLNNEINVLKEQLNTINKVAPNPDFDPSFADSPRKTLLGDSNGGSSQPYSDYVWVYACASLISRCIKRLPLKFYNVDTNETVENDLTNNLLKLFNKPNLFMTQTTFLESIMLGLLLPSKRGTGGQVFVVQRDKLTVDFFSNKLPVTLEVFNEDKVSVWDDNGIFKGWKVDFGNNIIKQFKLNEIIRISLYNPYNILKGLSPYSAGSLAIKTDVNASAITNTMYENGGILGGVLATEKGLTKVMIDEIKTQWRQSNQGISNTGSVPVLHSGLEYKEVSNTTIKDLGTIEQKKLNREEVLACYQVPPFMLGLTNDINRATADTSAKFFWENTLIPYCEIIVEAFNSQWFNYIGDGKTRLFFDLSNVQALKADITANIDNAQKLINQGVPASQAYAILDLPSVENAPWLDKPLVIGTRTDLSTGEIIGNPYGNYTNTEPAPTDTAPQNNGKSFNNNTVVNEELTKYLFKETASHDHGISVNLNNVNSLKKKELFLTRKNLLENIKANKEEYWKDYFAKVFDPLEISFQKMLVKYLKEQETLVLGIVDKWEQESTAIKEFSKLKHKNKIMLINVIQKALKINIDMNQALKDSQNAKLTKLSKPEYVKIVAGQAKQVKKELGGFIKWNVANSDMGKAIKNRAEFIQTINGTTWEMLDRKVGKLISDVVGGNVAGGEDLINSPKELAKLLRDTVKETYDIRLNNSKTIARTETATISSETRFDIFSTEDIEEHEWSSAIDEKTRDGEFSHVECDGETVKVGEYFQDSGEALLYPSDPKGSLGNIINCRCVALASIK